MAPVRRSVIVFGLLFLCVAACLLAQRAAAPGGVAELLRGFQNPPDDARIMMRWWWFGPSVVKPELERELRSMKEGGIGGVEIQPVYPVVLDDPARGFRNFPYLSDEFLDDVRFANNTARGLGLRVDITLGSGWPYGGPHTSIDLAAPRLRVDRVAVPAGAATVALPNVGPGEKLLAAFLANGEPRRESADGMRQLTGIDGPAVRLPDTSQAARVAMFFIQSRTRMQVKRAGVGAEGLVLDHYSRAAIDNHLKTVADRLMQAFGATPPYAVFSDSLEVAGSDWTADFPAEFQKRRGYDLTPLLPALAIDTPDSAAIRRDWGKTLTELTNERYLTPVREWAKAHGTRFRSQTYGTPPVNISSYAFVDLPEGEGSQWRTLSSTRWASSAGHLYDHPVTSSETWTWLHSPVFRATPLDMKAEADLHFLQGINQLIGHGWPYSPPEAGEPGWHFYAAAVFNNHNPWWLAMPDITRYLQRISFLLRQGKPVADVAVYLPTDDIYARFAPGRASINEGARTVLSPDLVPAILDAGYNLDFIDDDAMAQVGIPYPILVLPNVERIPLATYRKIEDYARKGGVVIAVGHAPSLAPGRMDAASETASVRQLSLALFEGPARSGKLVAADGNLAAALRAALTPDLYYKPPEIGFVHRTLPNAEVYFVVNTGNHPVTCECGFRVTGGAPAWWNPFTGAATGAQGPNPVHVELAPYESRVLVFPEHSLEAGRKTRPLAGVLYDMHRVSLDPVDISGGWKVSFAGSAQAVNMDRLASWTESGATRYFSGQATYEKTVTLDAAQLTSNSPLFLDFGEGTPVEATERRSGSGMRAMLESPVHEAAVVFVNGQRAGSVWCPPYQLEVGGLLHAGANSLRIVVANLAINALANQPVPDRKPLVAKYGDRFQDQDMSNLQPVPAGLLGPVRLVAK